MQNPSADAAPTADAFDDAQAPPNPCPTQVYPAEWHVVADPIATCIDGSPAVYFFSPGSGAGANRWLIDLDGGGHCSTVADCQNEITQQHYTSCRSDIGTQGSTDGIFSRNATDNPYFYQANIVFIFYCSGDLWSGDRAGGADNGNFPVRGRRILADVVSELAPQLASATDIVLGGQSAGGFGVLVNADRVADQLSALHVNARYSALSDSGWGYETDSAGALAAQKFWGMQPDDSCAAANAGQAWQCIQGPTLYPFLTSRTLVFVSQDDTAQIGNAGIKTTDTAGLAQFAQGMRSSFDGVAAPVSAFVPDRIGHVVTGSTAAMKASDVIIQGTSFWSYLQQWLPAQGSISNLIGL